MINLLTCTIMCVCLYCLAKTWPKCDTYHLMSLIWSHMSALATEITVKCDTYHLMSSIWSHMSAKATQITVNLTISLCISSYIKENIKALHFWPFWVWICWKWWIPLRKGQWHGKLFHVKMSWFFNDNTTILKWCTYIIYISLLSN